MTHFDFCASAPSSPISEEILSMSERDRQRRRVRERERDSKRTYFAFFSYFLRADFGMDLFNRSISFLSRPTCSCDVMLWLREDGRGGRKSGPSSEVVLVLRIANAL
jgi:hypothetical protein